MGEETITVGEVSRGEGAGESVDLPIVDLLTGRGFVTGKSGSGKSNSASVVAEKLLDRGYSLLAVDIDGEYYGLKEEYEILHVGADEECDLRVGVEHAEKIAELALEKNVPIILDVSSFLDESKARELLTEVTKHLFVKEKKLKQPFLMLIEEVHEYIPEGGGLDECGRMLIKVGKRGRKHGLGVVGISQRPADVKKDFITQCDWLVWHRLTWKNDTRVVSDILGNEYSEYIGELDDGECFLMTDWTEEIRPVQFERKRTFDAGATPGLEDFERPELKSVSGDLVEELQEITESQKRRENRIEELERELQRKEERIRDLERQLAEARDLKRMADRFSRAMMEQATGRTLSANGARQRELDEELEAVRNGEKEPEPSPVPDAAAEWAEANDDSTGDGEEAIADAGEDVADAGKADTADTGEADTDAPRESDTADAVGDTTDTGEADTAAADPDSLVTRLRNEIAALGDVERSMLEHYREYGPTTPPKAHAVAGGSGERTHAYAANRALRTRGFVAHVGRGYYDYALPELVAEETRDPFASGAEHSGDERPELVLRVEACFVEDVSPPSEGPADGNGTAGSDADADTDADSIESIDTP